MSSKPTHPAEDFLTPYRTGRAAWTGWIGRVFSSFGKTTSESSGGRNQEELDFYADNGFWAEQRGRLHYSMLKRNMELATERRAPIELRDLAGLELKRRRLLRELAEVEGQRRQLWRETERKGIEVPWQPDRAF